MINNPEFNRNLWLEFSTARLAISPLIAAAIVYIMYLAEPKHFFESLAGASSVAIWLIVVLWGVVQASNAVLSEVNGNTWVFQKMSGIGAWEMVIGKLFGTTAYVWYSASFFILAYIVSAFMLPDTFFLLKNLAITLTAALIAHSLTIMISLLAIRSGKLSGSAAKASTFIVLGFIIASSLTSPVTAMMEHKGDMGISHWYGFEVYFIDFYLLSLLYFLVWSVLGLYRAMRSELQYDNGPIVWSVFLLTLLVYINGLTLGEPKFSEILHGNVFLWTSFAVLAFITYVTMMAESFDPVVVRKFIDRVTKKDTQGASYLIPLWLPTMAGMLVFAVLLMINTAFSGSTTLTDTLHTYKVPNIIDVTFLPLAMTLFLLRDFVVFGLIKGSVSSKSDFYVMIYLLAVYVLLPTITGLLEAKQMLHVFLPIPTDGFLLQVGPAALELAIVVFLFIKYKLSAYNEQEIVETKNPL